MAERFIAFGVAVFIELVVPGRFIILAFVRIIAAEQPLFEGKIIPHQQAGIGVMLHVLGIDLIIFDQVQQHARQEGNVGTGTNRRIDIGHRRGTRKAWVDDDKRGIVCFSLPSPSGTPPDALRRRCRPSPPRR